jgi:hypothetical protein
LNPEDPFKQQLREWVFGSEDFLRWMIALAEGKDRHRHESTIRRVRAVTVMELHEATALHHGIDRLQYAAFRSAAPGRDMAAWLCRRWTGATLRELGPAFGLTGTDSVSNLVRLTGQQFKVSASWRKRASEIAASLYLNTEQKTRPRRSPPDSVSNLVRRAEQQFKGSASWRKRASEIAATLHLKTEHKT